jgi:hypothetical protein
MGTVNYFGLLDPGCGDGAVEALTELACCGMAGILAAVPGAAMSIWGWGFM